MTATQPAAHTRRGDVQGLRGIAVLLVLGFHAGGPSGAFVGVDVFFIISGFVITSGLLREAERTGTVSLRGFYLRRARRIAPASVATLAAVTAAAALLFPLQRAARTWLDVLWALFGAENWQQIITGSVPAASAPPASPLAHFWSLGVEEQFYFVWPLLLLGAVVVGRRWGPRGAAAAAATAVIVTSLAAGISTGGMLHVVSADGLTVTSGAVAYCSTFARGWELGAGALLAAAAPVVDRLSRLSRRLLTASGWSAVAVAAVTASMADPHPVIAAALPTVGTVALIAAGSGGSRSRLLESRPMQAVGELSYSLYLWHYPVLIFAAALLPASLAVNAAAVAFSVGLAWLSYRYVERPFLDGRAAAAVRSWWAPTRTRSTVSPASS